ncbi:hypothetical protein HK105_200847 [Polyrhizophydium stewartii]|uniref:S1 motif domain-containing protein n=1 Tax=Polyrhizophydium stewartii TaxID=2732419 RepID=A0ABR4NK76_9FUNG|nr:Exosome complex component CSL4 [Polyrhizophydium stewartii]
MSTKVLPGQRLGTTAEFRAGSGTYVRDGFVHAAVVGHRTLVRPGESADPAGAAPGAGAAAAAGADAAVPPTLAVVRDRHATAVPEIGSIIIGKVARVNPRLASLNIMVVGTTPCTETFQGVIRVQDVRATEKDKVQIYRSFRPGDVVRARVISLGDAKSYFLSTAENELGVVFAQSMAGYTMVPISWEEMVCPKTKVIEFRKCAKPPQQ